MVLRKVTLYSPLTVGRKKETVYFDPDVRCLQKAPAETVRAMVDIAARNEACPLTYRQSSNLLQGYRQDYYIFKA